MCSSYADPTVIERSPTRKAVYLSQGKSNVHFSNSYVITRQTHFLCEKPMTYFSPVKGVSENRSDISKHYQSEYRSCASEVITTNIDVSSGSIHTPHESISSNDFYTIKHSLNQSEQPSGSYSSENNMYACERKNKSLVYEQSNEFGFQDNFGKINYSNCHKGIKCDNNIDQYKQREITSHSPQYNEYEIPHSETDHRDINLSSDRPIDLTMRPNDDSDISLRQLDEDFIDGKIETVSHIAR